MIICNKKNYFRSAKLVIIKPYNNIALGRVANTTVFISEGTIKAWKSFKRDFINEIINYSITKHKQYYIIKKITFIFDFFLGAMSHERKRVAYH